MKKILCLVLASALLLSACAGNTAATTVSDTSTSTSQTTTEPTTTADKPAVTTAQPVKESAGLLSMTVEELRGLDLMFGYNGRDIFYGEIESRNIISDKEFAFEPKSGYLRQSSGAMYVKSIDPELYDKGIADNIKSVEFKSSFDTPYTLEIQGAVASLTPECKLEDAVFSYTMYNLSVNCFVDTSTGTIIIDPAYMQGIPMCSDEKADYKFAVSGRGFVADTISAEMNCENCSVPEKSCYARVSFSLNYSYGLYSGNASTADVKSIEVLTEDIEGVLSDNYLMVDGEGKDPAMTVAYNAISTALAELKTEKTIGVTLLDLDFNGTPEVIISNKNDGTPDDAYSATVNSDVYRLDGDKLIYVDTLYNYCRVVYDTGNILGIKKLDDGTRAWFQMSYFDRENGVVGDVDYLFTFDGEKLHFTEAIRASSEGPDENGSDLNGEIYIMGKKQTVDVEYDYDPYYDANDPYCADAKPDYPYLSCNGIKANFGMWELIGFIKSDFCKDITEVYTLDSDWLANIDFYGETTQKNLTDRMLSYNLASLVDNFYLGSYDASKREFFYEFLGAYAKPVIYLYPEAETTVDVSVDFADKDGAITCSYPEYNNGWTVTAMPDGTLYDENGDEYYCLYWEGEGKAALDMSEGFCVAGENTAAFLREKLLGMGFTAREANEMIIYWLPLMQNNAYNVITLHTDDYANAVALNVTPTPDSVIRVFMTFYASGKPIEIAPQTLPEYSRDGFTVVEWGGAEITVN